MIGVRGKGKLARKFSLPPRFIDSFIFLFLGCMDDDGYGDGGNDAEKEQNGKRLGKPDHKLLYARKKIYPALLTGGAQTTAKAVVFGALGVVDDLINA